jgi:hypothetical protein
MGPVWVEMVPTVMEFDVTPGWLEALAAPAGLPATPTVTTVAAKAAPARAVLARIPVM